MNALVNEHLSSNVEDPSNIFELFTKRFCRKSCSLGKYFTKKRYIYHVLNPSEIKKTKSSKGSIAFPIDLFFLLDYFLHKKVRKRSFCGRNHNSKRKGIFRRNLAPRRSSGFRCRRRHVDLCHLRYTVLSPICWNEILAATCDLIIFFSHVLCTDDACVTRLRSLPS